LHNSASLSYYASKSVNGAAGYACLKKKITEYLYFIHLSWSPKLNVQSPNLACAVNPQT